MYFRILIESRRLWILFTPVFGLGSIMFVTLGISDADRYKHVYKIKPCVPQIIVPAFQVIKLYCALVLFLIYSMHVGFAFLLFLYQGSLTSHWHDRIIFLHVFLKNGRIIFLFIIFIVTFTSIFSIKMASITF